MAVLHTFGSKLNFNCHIHILYTCGGLDINSLNWKYNDFIPYQALKSRFKTILLHYLRQEFKNGNVVVPKYVKNEWKSKFGTDVFFEVQNKLYEPDWYVYIGDKLNNVDMTVKYIGRYAKRPSLAETRIVYYSKPNNVVKFSYQDKQTGEEKMLTTTINDFLGLLFRHIPEKHFHMVRYYGAYANARKGKIYKLVADKLIYLFGVANLLFGPPRKTWRERMLAQTGTDPLKCSKCDLVMTLTEIHYRIRDGTMKTIHFF